MSKTIHTEQMTPAQIADALDGAAVVTDGVSEPWEPAAFLAALRADMGRPTGEYQVFTADGWAREVEEAAA